jgi:hypothetical protein
VRFSAAFERGYTAEFQLALDRMREIESGEKLKIEELAHSPVEVYRPLVRLTPVKSGAEAHALQTLRAD